MVLLVIDKPGLVINLPGKKSVRTPTKIDITGADINPILVYLKQYGVTQYKIIHVDKPPVKVKPKGIKSKPGLDLDPIYARFDGIEKLLSKLLNREVSPEQIIKYVGKEEPTIEEIDLPDDFIPEIQVDNLKVSGSSVKTTEGDEVEENVELLKKGSKTSARRKYKK